MEVTLSDILITWNGTKRRWTSRCFVNYKHCLNAKYVGVTTARLTAGIVGASGHWVCVLSTSTYTTWDRVNTQGICFLIEAITWYIKVRYCDYYCPGFSLGVNVGVDVWNKARKHESHLPTPRPEWVMGPQSILLLTRHFGPSWAMAFPDHWGERVRAELMSTRLQQTIKCPTDLYSLCRR